MTSEGQLRDLSFFGYLPTSCFKKVSITGLIELASSIDNGFRFLEGSNFLIKSKYALLNFACILCLLPIYYNIYNI